MRLTVAERLRASRLVGLVAAAAVIAAVTAVLYPLQELDPGVSSGVLYVLGVLVLSLTWGLWLGLVTSIASALALWLFHTAPGSVEAEDLVAIVVLLLTCVVASAIADRARLRADEAEERLRLEGELRRHDAERIRLEELRASRARVLAAADAERQRVVRDLHDGAQQRLVHTVVTLKLARRAIDPDAEAAAAIAEALGHAEAAVAELRELAHGILPAVLAHGLRPAVEALADRTSIPLELDVTRERMTPEIEATAYFVIAEALTNVVKHAQATCATVRAQPEHGVLRLEVSDDGVGAHRYDGMGLTGLADRLAVVDGAIEVRRGVSGGSHLSAAIPLQPRSTVAW